jgi:hypothetical protein
MELIIHKGKKICVGDQKLKDWIEWVVAIHSAFPTWFSLLLHDLIFLLIKKNYQNKFSTSSILKKIDKNNFEKNNNKRKQKKKIM